MILTIIIILLLMICINDVEIFLIKYKIHLFKYNLNPEYRKYIDELIENFLILKDDENIISIYVISPNKKLLLSKQSNVTGDYINHTIILPRETNQINITSINELEKYIFLNDNNYFVIITNYGKIIKNYSLNNDINLDNSTYNSNKLNDLLNNFTNSSIIINLTENKIIYSLDIYDCNYKFDENTINLINNFMPLDSIKFLDSIKNILIENEKNNNEIVQNLKYNGYFYLVLFLFSLFSSNFI